MPLTAAGLVDVLRAAGEPTRLRVLALLERDELAVMELSRILGQSQPRVSRHLRLLSEARLVERFPDGAWVFYRLAAAEPARALVSDLLDRLDPADPELRADAERLEAVLGERAAAAADYFGRNAPRWDELRSLHVDEAEVEAAIARAAGPGPFRRLIDLGTGAGRMLALLGPRAQAAMGLDLSQQMLNVARTDAGVAALGRRCDLRHGDITATGLPSGWADLVVIHRVLHYLADPRRRGGRGGAPAQLRRAPLDRRLRAPRAGAPARGPPAPAAGLLGRGDRALASRRRAGARAAGGAAARRCRRADRRAVERHARRRPGRRPGRRPSRPPPRRVRLIR